MARTLNLGILAHVDAGKTSLTERLLHAAGVIAEVGSVDDGSTQTDTLALERQRGITIKSAVVSFRIDDVTVNLIDTPGHPDFIAEVERALGVLDGAVLVVSAVEGVQAQTRVLMRTLRRLAVPTLVFVNKIDRAGAGYDRVLGGLAAKLGLTVAPMGSVVGIGTRDAGFMSFTGTDAGAVDALVDGLVDGLPERDDAFLTAYLDDASSVPYGQIRDRLAMQTRQALVHPVFFGSAITGAGVEALTAGITELLPAAQGDVDGLVAGTVFKIERGPAGEQIAYVRLFSGTIRTRDRVQVGDGLDRKVTAIGVFDRGTVVGQASVSAGQIAKLWGLAGVCIGDPIGSGRPTAGHSFAPPTLETVVVPRRAADKAALHVALSQLAEQDPLINFRRDEIRNELSVSLYGEVQKQVIEATLADDFGIDVTFRETTTICIERPIGTGEAVEMLHAESNPFLATIGLRVDPAPADSGVQFRMQVDHRAVPLHAYKSMQSFEDAMGRYVRKALQEGLFGWKVTDCIVTMTTCGYSSWDGPPSTRGPLSTAADFRKLTPLVVRQALARAGSVVCEPIVRASLEIPTGTISVVMDLLGRVGGAATMQSLQDELTTVETLVPAARLQDVQRQLPGLTLGEGVLESAFDHYEPRRAPA